MASETTTTAPIAPRSERPGSTRGDQGIKSKRPLTLAEWMTIARQARDAIAGLYRLVDGLLVTMPVAVRDRWLVILRKIEAHALWNLEECERRHHKRLDFGVKNLHTPIPYLDEDRFVSPWFRQTKRRGPLKRPLTRAEWIALGEEVKTARDLVTSIGFILQRGYPLLRSRPWFTLADRIDKFKSRLDRECHRQNPGWPAQPRVFYGAHLTPDDQRQVGVDPAEVTVIRTASDGAVGLVG